MTYLHRFGLRHIGFSFAVIDSVVLLKGMLPSMGPPCSFFDVFTQINLSRPSKEFDDADDEVTNDSRNIWT